MRGAGVTVNPQEQAGAIKKPPLGVQPGAANRCVVRVDFVAQQQELAGFAGNLPGAFIKLFNGQPGLALDRRAHV